MIQIETRLIKLLMFFLCSCNANKAEHNIDISLKESMDNYEKKVIFREGGKTFQEKILKPSRIEKDKVVSWRHTIDKIFLEDSLHYLELHYNEKRQITHITSHKVNDGLTTILFYDAKLLYSNSIHLDDGAWKDKEVQEAVFVYGEYCFKCHYPNTMNHNVFLKPENGKSFCKEIEDIHKKSLGAISSDELTCEQIEKIKIMIKYLNSDDRVVPK